jgi:hypothetical protein
MRRRNIPEAVLAKLAKFEKQAEYRTRKVTQTREAIASARQRLTGGFAKDSECYDLRATLDRLLEDLSASEGNEEAAKYTLSTCKTWLDELPDDAVLEVVKVKPNGHSLSDVRQRIKDAEDELKKLASVPVPPADIRERVEAYVASQGRPKVLGIEDGQLNIVWPNSTIAVLALLLPHEMVNALMQEIDRVSNLPMPLPERKRRMTELRREIDELQRQALALGEDASILTPEVVLGVRVAETKASRAA